MGAAWIDQRAPFRRSINAILAPPLAVKLPTATHACADGHDTPAKEAPVAPPGFGVGWIDQLAALAAPGNANSAPAATATKPAR